jgi:hypothetical protein
LQTSPAVLVEEYGRISGIITRHDVLDLKMNPALTNIAKHGERRKSVGSNRAAFHNYHISDKYEAGIALTGTEVKSAMGGRVQLKEAYVSVRDGEAWLFNAHISPYSHGNREITIPCARVSCCFTSAKYHVSTTRLQSKE